MAQIDENDLQRAFLHLTSGTVDKDASIEKQSSEKSASPCRKFLDLHMDSSSGDLALQQQLDLVRSDLTSLNKGLYDSLEILTGKGTGKLNQTVHSLIKSEFGNLKIVNQDNTKIIVQRKKS